MSFLSQISAAFKKVSQQNEELPIRNETEIAYFEEVVSESGVTLSFGSLPHTIKQEQMLVQRDMKKQLQNHILFPTNLDKFISELKCLCKQEVCFLKLLQPMQLKHIEDSNDVSISLPQQSLVRLLLNIECVQEMLVEFLLDEIADFILEETESTEKLRLFLNQLSYLPSVKNSENLSNRLVDLLDTAPFPAQLEILNMIPGIIPDSEHERTASELVKLLNRNSELIAALIDCLNELNLSTETRSGIVRFILEKLREFTKSDFLPVLFDFLLNDDDNSLLSDIIGSVRTATDEVLNGEQDSKKVLIFNKVLSFVMCKKRIADACINVISSIDSHSNHKPVDILILVMVHNKDKARKRLVEGLFKKRIKNGYFRIPLLEELFKTHLPSEVLKKTYKSLLEIGIALVSQPDGKVLEFSSRMYQLLFSHIHMDYMQRQDMLQSLILNINAVNKRYISALLNVIASLDRELLKLHVVYLMGLLDKFDLMELLQVKQIMGVICSLICGENEDQATSGLRDEIHMLIRKQLSSSKTILKYRGIISAVVMASTIIKTSREESQLEISTDDVIPIDSLPTRVAKEAATLLNLVSTCTAGCCESTGLYYDHLSWMFITTPDMEKNFVAWLYQIVTNDFQSKYITEEVAANSINDVSISMQFGLNKDEEIEAQIAVNIAELTLTGKKDILILASQFRLLRVVHFYQHSGNLSSIDALLGCDVLMPDLRDIESYDSHQLRYVSECILHCINWFREIVSAFVTQSSKKLKFRVMERLKALIELQALLNRCLKEIPNVKLPESYFDIPGEKKIAKVKKPAKRRDDTMDVTVASTSVLTEPRRKVPKRKDLKVVIPTITFREMDTDVIRLVKYPLRINDDELTQTSGLTLDQFEFLLSDFVQKIGDLNRANTSISRRMECIDPINIIKDCASFMPYIKRNLLVIVKEIDKLLIESDGIHDSIPMLTEKANSLKRGLGIIVHYFNHVFSWSGFQQIKHTNLLRDCLDALLDQQSLMMSSKKLTSDFGDFLAGLIDRCLLISTAVDLIKTLQALYAIHSQPDMKKKSALLSEKLLARRWYDEKGSEESGKIYNEDVDFLIKAYVSGFKVKTIYTVVETLQVHAENLKDKSDSLPAMSSINKQNFYLLYRNVCEALLQCVKVEVASLTNVEHLVLWRTVALTMQGLMTIAKCQETKQNLASFLKRSVGILKVFLSHGMPIIEIMLRSKTVEVVDILKIMQNSTRFLHHLCCQSKVTKDTALVTYVPQFKLTLESLLYRVKAALVANNCSAAFWMGTLKNKDIHGQDILTQQSSEASEIHAADSDPDQEMITDESAKEADDDNGDGSISDSY